VLVPSFNNNLRLPYEGLLHVLLFVSVISRMQILLLHAPDSTIAVIDSLFCSELDMATVGAVDAVVVISFF